MIISSENIEENALFEADMCIAGAGPAGISIALEFINSGKKIVLLAGGDFHETVINQELNKGIVVPKKSHEPLEENRRRVIGGATVAWGGRCIPFDAIDFKKRDWIKHSGWPITYEDLAPYYDKANELCKAGNNLYDSGNVFKSGGTEIFKTFDNEEIVSTKMERWSPPVDFGAEYEKVLRRAENITVLVDTHLVKINTENAAEEVSSVNASVKQKIITIKSGQYILAAGGIENPRLLLASKNKFYPSGIGNNYDMVGRYYMAHVAGIFAEVDPINRSEIIFDFETDDDGVVCRRRWWITEQAQRTHQIGNVIFYLHRAADQHGHRDPLFSVVFVAKFLLSLIKSKSIKKARIKWKDGIEDIKPHCKVILKDGWSQVPKIIKIARQRLGKRRLPFVLPSVKSKTLGVYFQTEQVPNINSRITVDDNDLDSTGVPRAVISIAFDEMDKKTIIDAHKIFIDRYQQQGLGNSNLDIKKLSAYVDEKIANFNSGGHHLGATRISESPEDGVVDPNCKVHGINNLYVTGGSVFPTGGHANPTLTIVAMALRLAEELKNKVNVNSF